MDGAVMTLQVLAVDDSRTMRDLLRITLTGAGMDAHLAEDGVAGLDVLDRIAPPDAIITDLNMPRMDGLGFIAQVRARKALRAVPILVLSTESAAQLKARARDAGATGWIVKPFQPDSLVTALRRVAG